MTNPLSFSSLKLDLFSKDGTRLNTASGFVLEAGKQYYLITNWHVVAGEQPASAAKPYTLKTSVHIHGITEERGDVFSRGVRKRITVRLYDDNELPTWIQNQMKQEGQHRADIVAFPIQADLTLGLFGGKIPGIVIDKDVRDENTAFWTKLSAVPISAIDANVDYGPADTVHIIGYPFHWQPDGRERSSSAFWRTSFIASEIYEPGMNRADIFFIDPCAPEGMTGSPVVGMKNDRMKLLGVYSDRSTADFGAGAGLVYGGWLIKELLHSL